MEKEKAIYNSFPDGFEVPKLKGTAAFKVVGNVKTAVGLPDKETIRVKVGEDYELVDIAVVKSQRANGDVQLEHIWFYAPNGMILLREDRPMDRKVYTQLMLSNHNGSNPNRDSSKTIIFELYEPAKKAKESNEKRRELALAQAAVAQMSEDAVKKYFEIKGESSSIDVEILRERLYGIAKKSPAQFIKNEGGIMPQENALEPFVQAQKKGLIKFDMSQYAWVWGDTEDVILKMSRKTKGKRIDGFLPFLKKEEGRKTRDRIKELLDTVE